MPRVTNAQRQARREEIVAAAIRAFTRQGYSRTSMSDIIAEAGLSAGAIYGHFEGKREIIAAVAQAVLGRRADELDAALRRDPPPTPGEALALLLRGIRRDGLEPRALVQVWAEATTDPEILATMHGAVETLQGALTRVLRAWFKTHPPAGPVAAEVRRLVPVMIALGQGYVVQHALLPAFDGDAYLETVQGLLPH